MAKLILDKVTPREEIWGRFMGSLCSTALFLSVLYLILTRSGVKWLVNLPYPIYLAGIVGIYVLAAAVVFLFTRRGNLANIARGFWKGVKRFGAFVTEVVNFVLLLPVYFIGVGVTSIVAKFFGKHFMLMKREKKKSYWVKYGLKTEKKEEYYKMY
jgi:hypothetical protein